jgi:1,4-dihydroxy-2-naphthoyl-CoA synthase
MMMKDNLQTLLYEQRGAVAIITKNRPDKLNACNTHMYKELTRLLSQIDQDKSIKAIIITGSGDKAFSAGADLEELNFDNLRESSDYIKIDATAFRAMENVRQPVIAAVNGAAIGYGCKVAIISDITVASEKARFSLPGATFGAVHMIMLGRAREVMGRKRLAEMLMTGQMIDAQRSTGQGAGNCQPDRCLPAAVHRGDPPHDAPWQRRRLPLGRPAQPWPAADGRSEGRSTRLYGRSQTQIHWKITSVRLITIEF